MTDPVCRLLEWDSQFFNRRIATVTSSRLTKATGDAVDEWCRAHRVDCVYLRAGPDDELTARVAAGRGFELVDVRLDFDRRLTGPPAAAADGDVRPARTEDVEELRAIAGTSHDTTRFYFDTRFPRERADELYRTWIAKSVAEGYADGVLVASRDGAAVGYITMHLENETDARIGLVGVARPWRGKGVGRALVEAASSWCAARGRSRVAVATQARNVAGVRLYERAGFQLAKVDVWYHYWPAAGGHAP
jgi:dTDP-4-amino-4,6-dideoxy-D-galactose acyltransferase